MRRDTEPGGCIDFLDKWNGNPSYVYCYPGGSQVGDREGVWETMEHEKQKTYGVCHEVCGREGCLQVSTLQQGVGEACHAGV